MKKQALGRGLGALIQTVEPTVAVGSSNFNEVDIDQIQANPNQPRTVFDDDALAELAESIKTNGIISPITLRKIRDGHYQIIAGERRYRASKIVGLSKIPAYIRTADEKEIMEMALIENIQREDLNAIEIALSYNNLALTYNLTQEALSERVGKKRTTIANYMRLLKLPAEVQMGLKDKKIEMGHARALAGLHDPIAQMKIYEKIVEDHSSVRQTEEIVRNWGEEKSPKTPKTTQILPEEYGEIKKSLTHILDSKINFSYNDKGKGKITIPFNDDEDLTRLMEIFDKLAYSQQ